MKLIALHINSGCELKFNNYDDMYDYVTPDIRSAWVYFFRYSNGFTTPHRNLDR